MTEINRSALFGRLQPHGPQEHRDRHRFLQAARQPVCRAGPLDAHPAAGSAQRRRRNPRALRPGRG
ncbi:hypothetical protein ACRAWD_15990 [Caulobacter segnis]